MRRQSGFTLIELMVVVTIIAIIAAFAVPGYQDYVLRGKLQEAYTNLSALRVNMEQYYQDNRMYNASGASGTCGIPGGNSPTVSNAKYFTYTCASTNANASGQDQGFTLTATGGTGASGFVFTINHQNVKVTSSVGSGWGTPTSNCWVLRKDGSC